MLDGKAGELKGSQGEILRRLEAGAITVDGAKEEGYRLLAELEEEMASSFFSRLRLPPGVKPLERLPETPDVQAFRRSLRRDWDAIVDGWLEAKASAQDK